MSLVINGGFREWGDIERSESGDRIDFPDIYVTRGPEFGPNFDPDDVEIITVGSATMDFAGCDAGTFSYSALDQSQTIPIQRLSQTMAGGCAPINGVPGFPIKAYAGQSGSWFDVDHSGEGFSLHWLANGDALLTWYTYDSEGKQQWMVGTGTLQNGQIVFESLNSTRGAKFGTAFDSSDVELIDWGRLTLEMNCDTGTANYDSNFTEFGTGSQNLQRLTQLTKPNCPWQRPKLADLYDFVITEIDFSPLADDSGRVSRDRNFTATDVASDGTVVGIRPLHLSNQLFVWSPQTETFSLSEPSIFSGDVFVTPSASYAVGTRLPEDNSDEYGRRAEPVWTINGADQWDPIPDMQFNRSVISGISQDGNHLVGSASPTQNTSEPWAWNVDTGQELFDLTPGMRTGIARSISNDGQVVVGDQADFSQGFRQDYATRWTKAAGPEILRDSNGTALAYSSTCNAACDVVPGSQHVPTIDSVDPNAHKFWLWTERTGTQYLDSELPQAIDSFFPPSRLVYDTTSDGSLFVGRYLAFIGGQRLNRPVIWTQRTGIEPLFEVLQGVEGWDDNWDDVRAIAVSTDGRKLLLTGKYFIEPRPTLGNYSRVMVIELIPK